LGEEENAPLIVAGPEFTQRAMTIAEAKKRIRKTFAYIFLSTMEKMGCGQPERYHDLGKPRQNQLIE